MYTKAEMQLKDWVTYNACKWKQLKDFGLERYID